MTFDASGDDRIEVVGESFHAADLMLAALPDAGGEVKRQQVATLVPERTNPKDPNAIKVMLGEHHVGYIARDLAKLLVDGVNARTSAFGAVTCPAEITGSGESMLGFGVVLYLKLQLLGVYVTVDGGATDELDDNLMLDEQSLASTAPLTSQADHASGALAPAAPALIAASFGHTAEVIAERRAVVERAVDRWKSELIDLSGRNRLLFFRELRTGTLLLDGVPQDQVFGLLQGKRVALSRLVSPKLPPVTQQSLLTPFEDAVRRLRSIARTARAYEEERGIRTLFLACGFVQWETPRAARPLNAPLLLVPVVARSRGAGQQDFELEVLGEPEVNPTLLHLLRTDHRIDLDEQELLARAEMDGGIDTPDEMAVVEDWITDACRDLPGWELQRRFALGNFWYAKLPMVRDLERSLDALASHDIAAALAGHQGAKTALAQRGTGQAQSTAEPQLVLDSDSSQTRAITEALSGRNLVIKGPPGTGKSQTITNLIASAIASGQRVLFVAEKRAAIEAVTKRLGQVGLGGLVLDLHSGAESKRWFAQQLGDSLEAIRASRSVSVDAARSRAERARGQLDTHVAALHGPLDPWKKSLFDAEVAAMELGPPVLAARIAPSDLERLREDDLAAAEDHLRDLEAYGALRFDATDSPWRRNDVSTTEQASAVDDALDVLAAHDFPSWVRAIEELAAACGRQVPRDRDSATSLLSDCAELELISARFGASLWERDLDADAGALAPLGRGGMSRWWAGLTNAAFKEARAAAESAWQASAEPEPGDLLDWVRRAATIQTAWAGATPAAGTAHTDLEARRPAIYDALDTLLPLVDPTLVAADLRPMASAFEGLVATRATVGVLPAVAERGAALRAAGLGPVLDGLCSVPELPDVGAELRRVHARSLADAIRRRPDRSSATAFRGSRHTEIADSFRSADVELIQGTAALVLRRAAEQAVRAQDTYPEQATLVRGQAAKKSRHLPVREVFAQAPDVVTALRPCWVMSPLMVSQLLPPDRAFFDLVVFDEASQVRPVEALSSMIRGRRLVVSGDERQLPPTSFFDQVTTTEDAAPAGEEETETQDFESILDVLRSMLETEMLRWHYRSRDERLIAFSNHEIYEGGLTTFPGAIDGEVLSHVLVDELPEAGEARVSPRAEVERVVELVLEHAATRPDESLGVIALGGVHADAIEARLLEVLRERSDRVLDEFFAEDREERFFVKNLERVQGDERDAIILAVGYGKTADGTLPHRFGPLNVEGGERRLNVAVSRAKRRMTVVSSFRGDDVDPARSPARGVRLLKAFLDYAARGGVAAQLTEDTELATALHRRIADALRVAGHEVVLAYGTSADRVDLAVVDPELGRVAVAVELDGPAYARRADARDRDRLRPEQLRRLGWQVVPTWSLDWLRDPEQAASDLAQQVQQALKAARAADAAAESPVVTAAAALLAEANAGALESATEAIDALGGGDVSTPITGGPAATTRDGVSVQGRGPRPTFASGGPAITDWRHADLVALARWIESDGSLLTAEELQRAMMTELGITRRGSRVAAALDAVVKELRG